MVIRTGFHLTESGKRKLFRKFNLRQNIIKVPNEKDASHVRNRDPPFPFRVNRRRINEEALVLTETISGGDFRANVHLTIQWTKDEEQKKKKQTCSRSPLDLYGNSKSIGWPVADTGLIWLRHAFRTQMQFPGTFTREITSREYYVRNPLLGSLETYWRFACFNFYSQTTKNWKK